MSNFIYPPRPRSKIYPPTLPNYEKQRAWVVQRKFNGTRNLIHITPDRDVYFWGREGKHEQFEPTRQLIEQVLSLNLETGNEYWFDSELLNNKTTTAWYKNRIVLFDVLQAGRYFFGDPNLMERQEILRKICNNPTQLEKENQLALVVTDQLWLAETFDKDFLGHYMDKIHLNEIEGLVLKKKNSTIDSFGGKYYEVDWQVRCRKEAKSYSH